MIKNIFIFVYVLCFSIFSNASEMKKYGQIMLTDGVDLYPNAEIPTPSEVDAIMTKATEAFDAANTLYSSSVALAESAQELSIKTSSLDGTQIVYGSCVAFGSQAVEVNTNATAMIIGQEFPSNVVGKVYVNIYVHYSEDLKNPPIVETANNLISPTWSSVEALETEFTTYPISGSPVECYRILVSFNGTENNLFLRTKGELKESVIGQFNVLYDLTVNGVRGFSGTNDWGIVQFGLLVDELDMTTFNEGE